MKEQHRDAYNTLLLYAIMSRVDYYKIEQHHIDVAAALESVERGDTKRLIVNLPPKTGKTELISKCFPEWYLGRNTGKSILFITHSSPVAYSVCMHIQKNMGTFLYSELFPSFIATTTQGNFIGNKLGNGQYYSTGVAGALVGRQADLIIMDTPIIPCKSSSEVFLHQLMAWYKYSVRCRLKPNGAIVICEAEQDTTFSSWILDEFKDENWEVIETPSEPYKWTTQYQQRPVREDEI